MNKSERKKKKWMWNCRDEEAVKKWINLCKEKYLNNEHSIL